MILKRGWYHCYFIIYGKVFCAFCVPSTALRKLRVVNKIGREGRQKKGRGCSQQRREKM